jgi:hypothetical protein
MTDKVVVRFLKAWRGYSADELAGFDQTVVEGLQTKGFAEIYDPSGETSPKSKGGKGKTAKAGAAKSENGPAAGAGTSEATTGPSGTTETGDGPDEEKP